VKLDAIKEICLWLPRWLDGRKGCSKERIY